MKKFLIFFISLFLALSVAQNIFAQSSQGVSIQPEQKYEASVIQVIEEGQLEALEGVSQSFQKVEVEITEGVLKGKKVIAQMGGTIVTNDVQKLKSGDKIFISHLQGIDGEDQFLVTDFIRRDSLYILAIAFFLAVIVVGGVRGLSSILGLIISFLVILKYIIPQIASGGNPIFIAISGSLIILLVTLYLAHGFNHKTHAAVLGTAISLLITGILAYFFVSFSRLSGLGSEEAGFLSMFPGMQINLQGILLGSIIIGALGVLDDITISQSACVFELREANKSLSWKQLYLRGLRVGREHIASLVNTLFLAYAGASLPLLLLFSLSGGEPVTVLINREMIANEIVRTLVGSLGLVAAVPITTALAAIFCIIKE